MEEEETKKLQKKKKKPQQEEQHQSSQSASKPPLQSLSPLNDLNLEMSSRSSLHSIPQPTVDSPPDSPTVSSIPDSHGSSPHTIIPTPAKTETPFRVTNGDFVEEEKKLGESRRQLRPSFSSAPRESKWGSLIRKALLGFRVTAFISCLVSFSVMVADRDKGWARDYFYNYKEFRFKFQTF